MASRPVKFPEIDDELRKIIGANMDEVPARKLAREAFKDIQLGVDHILFKVLFFEINIYYHFSNTNCLGARCYYCYYY